MWTGLRTPCMRLENLVFRVSHSKKVNSEKMSQEKLMAGSNSTLSLFLLILILFGLQSADSFAGDNAWSFAFMADTQSDFNDN